MCVKFAAAALALEKPGSGLNLAEKDWVLVGYWALARDLEVGVDHSELRRVLAEPGYLIGL